MFARALPILRARIFQICPNPLQHRGGISPPENPALRLDHIRNPLVKFRKIRCAAIGSTTSAVGSVVVFAHRVLTQTWVTPHTPQVLDAVFSAGSSSSRWP